MLLVNPGSPTIPRGMVGVLGTVGILDVTDDGTVEARIVLLLSPRYSAATIRTIDLPLSI